MTVSPHNARTPEVDALRGFALLGICLVNVPVMASGLNDWPILRTGWDAAATFIVSTFFETKFYVIFAFLFGWGMAYQDRAAAQAGQPVEGRLMRRMLGLIVLGGLNATFLFFGDILFTYGILGLLMLVLWRTDNRTLVNFALIGILIQAAFFALNAIVYAVVSETIGPIVYPVVGEGYLGALVEQVRQRTSDWVVTQPNSILFTGSGILGAFSLGVVAARNGFFGPGNPVYARLRRAVPWFMLIALPVNAVHGYLMASGRPESETALSLSAVMLAGPLLAACWVVGVVELSRRFGVPGFLRASGSSTLSAYLLQNVIGMFVFTASGLALFTKVGAGTQMLIAIAIWLGSSVAISFWLIAFRVGPAEWLLRALTYLSWPKLTRGE
jgi:uncharacterized protein